MVRNDLDRVLTGAPDPAFVRPVLAAIAGPPLARSFGPTVGLQPYDYALDAERTRLVQGERPVTDAVPAIDVYRVDAPSRRRRSNDRRGAGR